jgi:uncharacterized protein (DUF1697 family)
MTTYVALLRAVNVGGTGKLAMSTLRELCESAGLQNVRTYIQSGNVVFTSGLSSSKIQMLLGLALSKQLGKPAQVFVRSAAQMQQIHAANPFSTAEPGQVLVLFFEDAPHKTAIAALVIPGREQLVLLGKELFVHYPDGMGRSKLKLPFLDQATGRNMNTVAKLAEMAQAK